MFRNDVGRIVDIDECPNIEFIEIVDGDSKVLVGEGTVFGGCSNSNGP